MMKIINLIPAVGLLLCTQVALAGDKINESLDVTANGKISIENMRGKVEIIGWDKSEMSVSGELDDKAKGYEFETDDGYTIFNVKMPKHISQREWKKTDGSDLTIHLPIDSRVRFESVNGDVSVVKVHGGTKLHTVNGNIVAKNLHNRISLETVNGNIRATGLDGKIKLATVNGRVSDKKSKGKVSYETVNGSIDSDTSAEQVSVENVNGEIELDLDSSLDIEIATVNGDITAKIDLKDDSQISMTSVSGNMKLKVAGNTGGDYRLNSHAGGRIKNKLTDDKVKKQKYGPAQNLRFSIDGGGAKVEMTSVSGNLTISEQ